MIRTQQQLPEVIVQGVRRKLGCVMTPPEEVCVLDEDDKDDIKDWHQKEVEKFMEKAGHAARTTPAVPTAAERQARARLIVEEALEAVEALGVTFAPRDGDVDVVKIDDLVVVDVKSSDEIDLPELAKELADLTVVTYGTFSTCGIVAGPIEDRVDENNLAKFGPGGYKDVNGKWRKPPNHPKPDIARELRRQGWKQPEGNVNGQEDTGVPVPSAQQERE